MIGAALAYPFVLARRRPVVVGACLVAALGLSLAVDHAFIYAGHDPLALEHDDLADFAPSVAYELARVVVLAFPIGFWASVALVDEGVRDQNWRASLRDGALWAIISAVYTLLIFAPASFLAAYPQYGLLAPFAPDMPLETPPPTNFARTALSLAPIILLILLHPKIAMAWPHALATRRLSIRAAWRMSEGRYVAIAGVMLSAGAVVFSMDFLVTSLLTATGYYEIHGTLADVTDGMIATLSAFLFDAALAYAYVRIAPQRLVEAEEF